MLWHVYNYLYNYFASNRSDVLIAVRRMPHYLNYPASFIDTLKHEQNSYDIIKCIFLNIFFVFIQISLKFILDDPSDNRSIDV